MFDSTCRSAIGLAPPFPVTSFRRAHFRGAITESKPGSYREVRGWLLSGSLPELVGNLTTLSGRQPAPPAWVDSGLIVGAEGGHAIVRAGVSQGSERRPPVRAS